MTAALPVLLVAGLAAEARVAAGPGVVAVAGGGDPDRLAGLLRAAVARGARAIISFGIAGGLEPGLRPGIQLVAGAVHAGGERLPADPAWAERFLAALPGARLADLAGVDAPAATAADKARLRARTGAAAVDMESHIAARLAAEHGLPFAALRIVADPAERTLPSAALVGMGPDGATDLRAVLLSLARRPGQLPGLIRTGLDARAAFASLAAGRRRLAPLFDPGAAARPTAAGLAAPAGTPAG